MVAFALNQLNPVVIELNHHNYVNAEENANGWVVDFCDATEQNCLSETGRRKLAAMLNGVHMRHSLCNERFVLVGLVIVGTVDCNKEEEKLCKTLNRQTGVAYYKRVDGSDQGHAIESLDAREIASAVLQLLPNMNELTPDDLQVPNEFMLRS